MTAHLASWLALALGVVAYGIGGANLASGSSEGLRNALVSRSWWLGTGCQGVGFLFTLFARRDLPLLLVQACVVAALVITALIQHVTGARRMSRGDIAAVAAVMAAVAVLGTSTVTGPAPAADWTEAVVLAATVTVLILCLLPRLGSTSASVVYGCASGVGFGVMAVAARLLISDTVHPLWFFWRLPLLSWCIGVIGVVGLGLGQVHLTRGLARGHSVGVLSCMYGLATVYGAIVGLILLDETPRPGRTPFLVGGLVLGLIGTARLLRHVEEPVTASP